jgi:hypothetical protein
MSSYKLVVFSNPSPGAEEEFNDWYDNTHLEDLLRVDGVISAQRFVIEGAFGETNVGAKYKYLAIYDIDTDDIKAVMAEMEKRSGTEQMALSEAFSLDYDAPLFKMIFSIKRRSDDAQDHVNLGGGKSATGLPFRGEQ